MPKYTPEIDEEQWREMVEAIYQWHDKSLETLRLEESDS